MIALSLRLVLATPGWSAPALRNAALGSAGTIRTSFPAPDCRRNPNNTPAALFALTGRQITAVIFMPFDMRRTTLSLLLPDGLLAGVMGGAFGVDLRPNFSRFRASQAWL